MRITKKSFCAFAESPVTPGLGSCTFVGGSSPSVEEDEESSYLVTKCVADNSNVKSSGKGYFAQNTVVLPFVGNETTTVAETKEACEAIGTCVGFHEIPIPAKSPYCTATSAFETTSILQSATTNPDVIQSVEECMIQCVGVQVSGAAASHVKFVKGTECRCKRQLANVGCSETPNTLATALQVNHYPIDVTFDVVDDTRSNIKVNRPKKYEMFTYVDTYSIDSSSVFGLSSEYYMRPSSACVWCTWSNTEPKTYVDDSETCMTNVLDHLVNDQSFESYLDNIGPALDMEQEICVQKNNVYRTPGSKHIPCGYNNLYNFDMDSVYPPEQFEVTEEEISYRLNPSVPSWDSLIFHPDDVGDIANHYEPVTRNFILPIKAEIVIQGHHCHDDYDFAAAPGTTPQRRRRRRMLGNRRRKRIGRKLLQADGTPTNQFGSTDGVAFNIHFDLTVTASTTSGGGGNGDSQSVSVDGVVLYPGDSGYPSSPHQQVANTASLNATNTTADCVAEEQALLLSLTYGSYYGIILIISLLSLAADLKLNKFK